LFSTLESLVGPLSGRALADLYAGSGAVGLEALSRGAEHVLLVESEVRAARTIRANLALLAMPGATVVTGKVERVLADPPVAGAYDVVFLDPPYATPAATVDRVLTALVTGGWLAPDAVVAVERASRDGGPAWPEGLVPERSRRYGEGTLWYGRAAPSEPPA
jgi:16S rRNA (guanine966-N2)-methyltransferase